MYIQAQQAILSATQFVIELNKTVKSGGDMTRIYARMKEMEQYLEPLNTVADSWILQSTTTTPLDPTEEILSRSLRCMARIKLNRRVSPIKLRAIADHQQRADQDPPLLCLL